MLTTILPILRLAGPVLALLFVLLSGAFAVQYRDLAVTREALVQTQEQLQFSQATVANYEALSARHLEQQKVNQKKVTELSRKFTSKVKTLKSQPVDNTLPAIAQRGVATAKEASSLWND